MPDPLDDRMRRHEALQFVVTCFPCQTFEETLERAILLQRYLDTGELPATPPSPEC